MELNDTVDLMTSDDYKQRFKAEYHQVRIRYVRLKEMIEKYEDGSLEFNPSCPLWVLKAQERVMREYMDILVHRAALEKISLSDIS